MSSLSITEEEFLREIRMKQEFTPNKYENAMEKYTDLLAIFSFKILTDSNNDDLTAAVINPLLLIFARTGAPKPIEESCRLRKENHRQKHNLTKIAMSIRQTLVDMMLPFGNGFLQINKCSTTNKKYVFRIYLQHYKVIEYTKTTPHRKKKKKKKRVASAQSQSDHQ